MIWSVRRNKKMKITEIELLKEIAKNPEPYLQFMIIYHIGKIIYEKELKK